MTRVDARVARSAPAIVAASSPASAGRRVHLPVRGDDDGAHRPNHARGGRPVAGRVRGRPRPRGRRPDRPRPGGAPAARSARGPAGRPSGGARAARRARRASPPGVSRRASATSRTTYGCSASSPLAVSSSIAAIWRPAAPTARWRFADSALRTRFRSPRSARDTWRASSSRSAAARPDPAQEQPDVSPFFQVTTPRPRRIRHEAGSSAPLEPARRATRRLGGRDDELEVGPAAGQAERAAGEEQAAEPGHPAMVGARRPSRTERPRRGRRRSRGRRRPRRCPLPRSRSSSRATGPSRAAPARRQAGRLGPPVARPRRVDRGELGAEGQRRGRARERAHRRRHSAPRCRRQARSGGARRGAGAALALVELQDAPRRAGRDRGAGRAPGRRRRRATSRGAASRGRRPAQADRLGARSSAGTRAPNRLLARTASTIPAPAWATSASTWPARSRPVVSPSWVATLQT